MSPQAQRIAIATACGWHRRRVDHGEDFEAYGAWFKNGVGHHLTLDCLLPDYLNDLNAMHEAESTLDDQTAQQYRLELMLRAGGLAHHRAPAAQRAEAFLRTLGRWEESK